MISKAPIGWPVQFFSNADRNAKPVAATIVDMTDSGIATLSCVPIGAAELSYRRSVRHMNDAWLQDHPELARTSGGWDFVPGLVPPEELRLPTEDRIMAMFNGGAKAEDIAEAVGRKEKYVESVIERHTEPAAATAG